jgi:hypothetical protein
MLLFFLKEKNGFRIYTYLKLKKINFNEYRFTKDFLAFFDKISVLIPNIISAILY